MTRDGRKALVGEVQNSGLAGIIISNKNGAVNPFHWTRAGVCRVWLERSLVGPWVEPPKPLELWVNYHEAGWNGGYETKEQAERHSRSCLPRPIRTAVHMREVTEKE